MQSLFQIATLIIQTVASLYLVFVVLRFLLQLARADFYNPFSQAIVKITNPLLMPLRKVVPGFFGVDFACIVLALVISFVAIELNLLIITGALQNPLIILIWAVLGLLKLITYIILGGLIISIIASFVAPHSSHPILLLVNQLMTPIRAPFSKVLPPMGGLDFSPILLILAINIVWILLDAGADQVFLNPNFVPGY
jgi:YggT family protein